MGQKVPMGLLFVCVACLHQRACRLKPLFCEHCGRTETFSIAESSSASTAIAALDIPIEDVERFPSGDTELDSALLGGFVRPSTLTAFGIAGVGKSRSALRWATHLGKTLLVSLEMPAKLAVLSAKEARADLSKLFVTESEDDWQSDADKLCAQIVVFDSFHYSQKQRVIPGSKVPRVCYELSEWTKRANGIAMMIAHQNKKGRVSGKTDVEHWPDYLFKLERHGRDEAKVLITKARYAPSGSAIVRI